MINSERVSNISIAAGFLGVGRIGSELRRGETKFVEASQIVASRVESSRDESSLFEPSPVEPSRTCCLDVETRWVVDFNRQTTIPDAPQNNLQNKNKKRKTKTKKRKKNQKKRKKKSCESHRKSCWLTKRLGVSSLQPVNPSLIPRPGQEY